MLSLASSILPSSPSATRAVFRAIRTGDHSAFLIGPHAQFVAVALQLMRGNAGDTAVPADSVGPPYGDWRIAGYRLLPSIDADPLTEASEIVGEGIGAQQIAIRRTTGGGWAGHYHGFGTGADYAQTAPDLSGDTMTSDATIRSLGRARWSDGAYFDFDESVRLSSDGAIITRAEVSMPFDPNIAYLDMTIAGPEFSRASLDGGATWQDLSQLAVGADLPPKVDTVVLRNPGSGTTLTVTDDALDGTPGRAKRILRRAADYKIYPDLNPTPNPRDLGRILVRRTIRFGRTAPDPVAPKTAIWDGTTDGDPRSRPYFYHNYPSAQLTWNQAQQGLALDRSLGQANTYPRMTFALTGLTPGQSYAIQVFGAITAGTSPSGGTTIGLADNAGGASATTLGSFAANGPSYAFIAPGATCYLSIQQAGSPGNPGAILITGIGLPQPQ